MDTLLLDTSVLTASEARRLLDYRPDTGEFFWRVRKGSTAPAGARTGNQNPKGYIQIRINHRLYYAHRLAWLMMTGSWPVQQIDHINCDKSDNRFCNLRAATAHDNRGNAPKSANNTSGFKGVSRDQRCGRWEAFIMHGRKKQHLGRYDTPEEAHAAYVRAAVEHFGEFARAG